MVVAVVNEAFENRAAPQFFFLRLRVVTDGLNECDEIAVASGFAIVCGPQECSYREIVEAASVVGSVKALGGKDAAEGIVDVDELKFRQTDSGFCARRAVTYSQAPLSRSSLMLGNLAKQSRPFSSAKPALGREPPRADAFSAKRSREAADRMSPDSIRRAVWQSSARSEALG